VHSNLLFENMIEMKRQTEPTPRRDDWRAALVHAICALVLALSVAGCGAEAATLDDDRIIISGASGQLGGLVVEELLARGVEPSRLILVSRTPETLDRYAALGASTRFGDFTVPESLDSAYAGGTRLLLISLNTVNNPNPRVASERQALHQDAIDAAVRAGVRHVVYTSYVDADNNPSPIAVDHRATEAMLRSSGVAWTALRNQWYAHGLVGQAAQMVAAGRVVVDPAERGAAWVTREDCAIAAAAALMAPISESRIFEITGPELVGPAELARIASEVTGRPIEVVEAGPGDTPTGAAADRGSGATLTDDFERLTGRAPTSVRQLLTENREAILGTE
jgi:NAD(P)H dehydrogenase (quinone)